MIKINSKIFIENIPAMKLLLSKGDSWLYQQMLFDLKGDFLEIKVKSMYGNALLRTPVENPKGDKWNFLADVALVLTVERLAKKADTLDLDVIESELVIVQDRETHKRKVPQGHEKSFTVKKVETEYKIVEYNLNQFTNLKSALTQFSTLLGRYKDNTSNYVNNFFHIAPVDSRLFIAGEIDMGMVQFDKPLNASDQSIYLVSRLFSQIVKKLPKSEKVTISYSTRNTRIQTEYMTIWLNSLNIKNKPERQPRDVYRFLELEMEGGFYFEIEAKQFNDVIKTAFGYSNKKDLLSATLTVNTRKLGFNFYNDLFDYETTLDIDSNCSVEFELWVYRRITQMLKGKETYKITYNNVVGLLKIEFENTTLILNGG